MITIALLTLNTVLITSPSVIGPTSDLNGPYNPDTGTYQAASPTPAPKSIVTCNQLLGAASNVTGAAHLVTLYASTMTRNEALGYLGKAKRDQDFVTANLSQCHQPEFLDAILAYNTTTYALALKDSRMPWKTEMILANQRLHTCIVNFYGSDVGAECESQLEQNIRLQD